jgi:hypothetical protein
MNKKKVLCILFNYADNSGMNEYKMWMRVGEENYIGKVEEITEETFSPEPYCYQTNYRVRFVGGKSMLAKSADIVHYSEEDV